MIDDIKATKILKLRQKKVPEETILKNKGEKNDF
jgi:hypothetical protein